MPDKGIRKMRKKK